MAFSRTLLLATILGACCSQVLSYRILVLVTMHARSHYNLGRGVADILHENGHEITFVSFLPATKPVYREIEIPELAAIKDDRMINFEMDSKSKMWMMLEMRPFMQRLLEATLTSAGLRRLLEDETEKFDLVVVEYVMNEVFQGLGVKYDCPVLLLSPITLMHSLARDTGNPVSPATIPNIFLSFTGEMSLAQRFANTAMAVIQEISDRFIFKPLHEELYKKHFPAEAARVPYSQVSAKVAVTLINTHSSIGTPRPLLPNAIEIGGYHVGPTKPLPQDLQEILDNAKNGVVFFSMGSNLRSKELPDATREAILKSLSKLKQTVLWKFETDLPGKPDNVIIRDWLPQASILAHKNVRLFISHGGLLSLIEAAGAGVPLLAIPIFGDQHYNSKATQERGHGLELLYSNLTEETLTDSLNELLTNDKYTKKAQEIYRLFHDRPVGPRELVNYYAEYVIRNGGAPHLAPPKVSLCSLLLLDVAAVVLLPPLLVLLAICWCCRKRRCCKAKKEQDKSKLNPKKNN